jgi:hypothetical protein
MNGSTANESPPNDENGAEGIRQRKHSHSRVKTEETNKSEPKEKDYTKDQLEAGPPTFHKTNVLHNKLKK